MKVGILTYHHTTNYGATLQTYALYKTIKNLGHEVELINYQPHKAIKTYLDVLYFKAPPSHFVRNLLKSLRMRHFLTSEMKLSQGICYTRSGMKKFSHQYDCVIVGSDEVWNINSFRGFDQSYFLDFLSSETTRKASYAASFGSTNALGTRQAQVKQLLSDFQAISVRDSNSLKIVTEDCNQKAVKVLDPTFLADYSQVLSCPDSSEKYILVYGLLSAKEASIVKKLSETRNLSIVSVGYENRMAQKNFVAADPTQWLGYFAKAEYVFTHFYHGVIFSIIFKKPFTVFSKQDKLIKVSDLLNWLNLEERILINAEEFNYKNECFSDIDYARVRETLEKGIFNSKNYLLEVLNGKY